MLVGTTNMSYFGDMKVLCTGCHLLHYALRNTTGLGATYYAPKGSMLLIVFKRDMRSQKAHGYRRLVQLPLSPQECHIPNLG